jgi:cytochrome c5
MVRVLERRTFAAVLMMAMSAAACAGKMPRPATPADVQWAQGRWPGMAAGDLEAGRQVLVTKCANCHRAPLPEEHSSDAWPGYISEMAGRAKLTPEDRSVLEQYVLTLSRPPST